MTASLERTAPAGTGAPGRAQLDTRTLRKDRWWLQPLITVTVLVAFIIYATVRAFWNKHYFHDPYISPFYSPCLSSSCDAGAPLVLAPDERLHHPGGASSWCSRWASG